jgi:hypothetical protein
VPTTRRGRQRARQSAEPDVLDLLRRGEEIPFSRENRRTLVEAIYLIPAKGGEKLPQDIEQRALQVLARWQAEGH